MGGRSYKRLLDSPRVRKRAGHQFDSKHHIVNQQSNLLAMFLLIHNCAGRNLCLLLFCPFLLFYLSYLSYFPLFVSSFKPLNPYCHVYAIGSFSRGFCVQPKIGVQPFVAPPQRPSRMSPLPSCSWVHYRLALLFQCTTR